MDKKYYGWDEPIWVQRIKEFFGFGWCVRCGKWHRAKQLIVAGSWFVCPACNKEMKGRD